jgi:hypothetical protein
MKKIVFAVLLLPVCAFGIETTDCARDTLLSSLYELRAVMIHGASSYDVNKFIDARTDALRGPMSNGSYRWVRWARPSGSPQYDKKGHTVNAVHGSGSDSVEASADHVYAVRVAVPAKRSLIHGNNPVYVGTMHVRYTVDGRDRTKDEPINNWMSPDTTKTVDLNGIADHVEVSLDSSVNKSDANEALVEIHSLKAVAQDDPSNPNYDAIITLKRIRDAFDPAVIDDEITRLAPNDDLPLMHIVQDLRHADDLIHSKKTEDQEKGERLLKETVRRLR